MSEAKFDATLLEGISGMWHYHLGIDGKAACGNERVMNTDAPLDTWGYKPKHMPTSYCAACEQIRRES